MAVHRESVFGDAIVASLLASGWKLGSSADYQRDLGLDTGQLFTFIGIFPDCSKVALSGDIVKVDLPPVVAASVP